MKAFLTNIPVYSGMLGALAAFIISQAVALGAAIGILHVFQPYLIRELVFPIMYVGAIATYIFIVDKLSRRWNPYWDLN